MKDIKLVQRKKNNREECIIPGGKRKEGSYKNGVWKIIEKQ